MRGVVSACSLQESNHRGFLPRKGPGTLLYYFHGVLEHLKTNFEQIFASKGSWFCNRVRLNFEAFA